MSIFTKIGVKNPLGKAGAKLRKENPDYVSFFDKFLEGKMSDNSSFNEKFYRMLTNVLIS